MTSGCTCENRYRLNKMALERQGVEKKTIDEAKNSPMIMWMIS